MTASRVIRLLSVLIAAAMVVVGACGNGPAEPEAAPTTAGEGASEPSAPSPHVHSGQTLFEKGVRRAADGRRERLLSTEADGDVVMIEVSEREPDDEPTRAERAAAREFVAAVREATRDYARLEDALDAGYEHWPGIDDLHFANVDHVTSGELLNPERPEFLMYDRSGDLLAAMFLAPGNEEPGPQFGGPLTTWHYHPAGPSCWDAGGLLPAVEEPSGEGECPAGLVYSERSPEMLHVWVVDHDDGPFSSDMVTPVGAP